MGEPDHRALLSAFFAAVQARMDKGAVEYADRNLGETLPQDLLREILEELEDVAGWAALAWGRLARLRQRMERDGWMETGNWTPPELTHT